MNRRPMWELAVLTVAVALVLGILAGVYLVTVGVSARSEPGRVETFVARTVRNLAIVRHAPDVQNPVPGGDEAIAAGRAHFADHCASCHANDGSGETEMGRGLYPRAPDMRLPATQDLSDHELFYIIENGIRFTGMPGWTTGTKAGEEDSWRLVYFVRHLPTITPDEIEEMEALNPKSPDEIRQEIAAEEFLRGGDSAPSAPEAPSHEHGDAHE